jgi:perosamine synthetase
MAEISENIPWWEPKLGQPVRQAVNAVLDSDYINDGPVTRDLEARVAAIAGRRHGIAATSCTASIALALMAAGIEPGDEVIVPDITFIATANAARLAGARVRLVDVDPLRLTLDPGRLAEAIGPNTRAVIAVDINGRAADYAGIEAVCRERGLILICDSAQGLGSRHGGRAVGSFGDAACFSFSGNKMFFAGQGGAIVTDDDAMEGRLRALRDHGRLAGGTGGDDMHPVVGFNFKYPNLQAAVALAQLDELDERLEHARLRQRWYREFLDGCPGLSFPGGGGDNEEAILWSDILIEDRDPVCQALDAAAIGYRRFYFPLHRQEPYAAPDDGFPNALHVSTRLLWLPSALSLTRAQAERTATVIRQALDG